MAIVLRSGSLNYDTNAAGDESGLECTDPSLTIQSQRDDADINIIMKRYGITGRVPVVPVPPTFGDFEAISDYREAMDVIIAADRSFGLLNADVRARFSNDPQKFLEFCADAKNLPEMRKLGLAIPKPITPEAVKAEEKAK